MKKILSILIGLLCAFNCWAVKSYPFPVEVRQTDGATLTIVQHGDENFHYYTTLDGILLVQREGGYYIGAVDERGTLTATSLLAHDAAERSAEEVRQASLQNRAAFLAAGEKLRSMRRAKQEPIGDSDLRNFPHVGSPRAIVILAEFSDSVRYTLENPRRSFDEYFNGTSPLEDHGGGEARNFTSVGEYFKKVSFGQFTPQFDVYGPVTLPNSLATYGADHGGDGDGEHSKTHSEPADLGETDHSAGKIAAFLAETPAGEHVKGKAALSTDPTQGAGVASQDQTTKKKRPDEAREIQSGSQVLASPHGSGEEGEAKHHHEHAEGALATRRIDTTVSVVDVPFLVLFTHIPLRFV